MLNKSQIKVLEKLMENIRSDITLSDMSKALKQKYPQTYRTIKSLVALDLVKIKKVGKSKVLKPDFSEYHPEYAMAEIKRLTDIVKNNKISVILSKIVNLNNQFICILFGSHASGTSKKDSDIDLLFIVPDKYNLVRFEKAVINSLSLYDVDINVITEDSLFEMWSTPEKLNVGNELFKSHVVLIGAEAFLNLVRKSHVGR